MSGSAVVRSILGCTLMAICLPAQQVALPDYADVEAIFQERCIICHNGPGAPKKLQLTSYTNAMTGSENGPVIKPGDAQNSELVRRIRGLTLPRMPLTGPPWLSDAQIETIERWIANGAPDAQKTVSLPDTAGKISSEKRSDFVNYSDVEEIFKLRCVKCHNTKGLLGPPPEGLILNSYKNILDSRDRARVIPGNPEASELMRRVLGQALPRMPFDGPPYLNEEEIQLIREWIAQGARDANDNEGAVPVGAKVRLHGQLNGEWDLDGLDLQVGGSARIEKSPKTGDYVEVRGRITGDGQISVERIRRR